MVSTTVRFTALKRLERVGGASCSRCRTRYAGVEASAEGFKQHIF